MWEEGIGTQFSWLGLGQGCDFDKVFDPFGSEKNRFYRHVRIFQLLKSLGGDTNESEYTQDLADQMFIPVRDE